MPEYRPFPFAAWRKGRTHDATFSVDAVKACQQRTGAGSRPGQAASEAIMKRGFTFYTTKIALLLERKARPVFSLLSLGFLRKTASLLKAHFSRSTSFYPPHVVAFERAFATFTQSKHAVTFCNGTSSIEAALFAVGIREDDEVLVPSCTFHASIDPILNLGARPIFVDVDPKSFTMSPEDAKEKITERTRCILVVHIWGTPADMNALGKLAAENGLRVVEDCSHAHGALFDGRPVGSLGDVGCFSLQAHKPISAGEGGVAVTNDANLYQRLLLFGHYGRNGDMHEHTRYAAMRHTGVGYKRRIHPFGVCLAAVDLDNIEVINARKRRASTTIHNALEGIDGISPVSPPTGGQQGGFAMGCPLILETDGVDDELLSRFVRYLRIAGLQVSRYPFLRHHFLPHYIDTAYRKRVLHQQELSPGASDCHPVPLPVTDSAHSGLVFLSLDCHPLIVKHCFGNAVRWAWNAAKETPGPIVPGIIGKVRNRVLHSELWTLALGRLMGKRIRAYYQGIHTPQETLYFSCTNKCNAKCLFCVHRKVNPSPETMPVDDFKRYVTTYIQAGGRHIGLTPTIGDPLLDEYLVQRLEFIDGSDIETVKFYTNLIALDEKHLEAFEGIRNTKLLIGISITGFNAKDYAHHMGVPRFEKVKENLTRLSKLENRHVDIFVMLRNYGVPNYRNTEIYRHLINNTALPARYAQESDFISIQGEFRNWGGAMDQDLREYGLTESEKKLRFGPCVTMYQKNKIDENGKYLLCEPHDYMKCLHAGHADDMLDPAHWERVNNLRDSISTKDTFPASCAECSLYESIYSLNSLRHVRRLMRKRAKQS